MSCYLMHFEGQALMWEVQPAPKSSHAILRQALLCPEKEKDNVIFTLDEKRPVRGGDPFLGANDEQADNNVIRCRKRRLSDSSLFDVSVVAAASSAANGSKFKTHPSAEKLLFESAADLIQDDIHTEMEVAAHLPSDGSEYTSHLLSQLSSSSLLPTMTSSQVSSVLSALEPNTIAQLPTIVPTTANSRIKCSDHATSCTTTEFVKHPNEITSLTIVQDHLQSPENLALDKTKKKRTFCLSTKAIIRYYTENRIKGNTWYQCSCCPFMSVNKNTIVQHCIMSHDGSIGNSKSNSISSNLHLYKCLGCDNVFSSTHSLKVHYLYDHNVTNDEVEDLLKLTIEIDKYLKSAQPNFTQLKPQHHTTLASEKNIQIQTPTVNCDTIQQVPEEPDSVEVANHTSSTPLFPLFFEDGEHQSNNQSHPIPLETPTTQCTPSTTVELPPSSQISPTIVATALPQTSSAVDLTPPSHPVDLETNKIQVHQPTTTSTKIKDPALKKFRDLKLEKGGGKKCGLGGCALRFGAISNLEYHKKCHHRTKWRCPECHISCTSWNTVSSHLWREHGIDIELYSCDHCSYKTNSLTRLLNLHRRIHSEERPFLCDVCGKGFKTTKQLRNHKSWHKLKEKSKSENAEKLVTCITCGRGFTCARLMRLHVQVVHKRLKPYLCYVCGHSAANKSSLRSHLSMHTGLRPYSCDQCDYTTRDHNNLRRHKMRHSGLKRYQCPLCSYSSIQASTYKTHILKKHPGQQDGLLYRCNICPFNTVKKENLLTHSARHEVMKSQDTPVT